MLPEYFFLNSLQFVLTSSAGAIIGKIASYLSDKVVDYVTSDTTNIDADLPSYQTIFPSAPVLIEEGFLLVDKVNINNNITNIQPKSLVGEEHSSRLNQDYIIAL